MSVKRLDIYGPDGWMEEWHEGEYVRFEDYETLKNSHDELWKCLAVANAIQQHNWSAEFEERMRNALVTAQKLENNNEPS